MYQLLRNMIVIGIDPGTTTTGYAIVEKRVNSKNLLDYGIIKTTPKTQIKDKILEISKDLNFLIKKYCPSVAVIEKLFFSANTKTAVDVAQIRGVILYVLASKNIEILEFAPLELKKALCLNGKASKLQLQNTIKMLFGLSEIPAPDDAADAIGLAYMGILKNFTSQILL